MPVEFCHRLKQDSGISRSSSKAPRQPFTIGLYSSREFSVMGDKGKKEKKKKKVKSPVKDKTTVSALLNPATVPNKTNTPSKK